MTDTIETSVLELRAAMQAAKGNTVKVDAAAKDYFAKTGVRYPTVAETVLAFAHTLELCGFPQDVSIAICEIAAGEVAEIMDANDAKPEDDCDSQGWAKGEEIPF